MPYSSKQEAEEKQAEFRRQQQLKDKGNTLGTDAKNPCKKVKYLKFNLKKK